MARGENGMGGECAFETNLKIIVGGGMYRPLHRVRARMYEPARRSRTPAQNSSASTCFYISKNGKVCHNERITSEDTVMSLNVSLPPELEARVRQKVESGLYGSASEVIREALRLFEAYENARAATLASLRADISQGMADIEAGSVREIDPEEIKRRGRRLLQQRQAVK